MHHKTLFCLFLWAVVPAVMGQGKTAQTFHRDHRSQWVKLDILEAQSAPQQQGEALARGFLKANAQRYGISSDLSGLSLNQVKQSLLATHYHFAQTLNGIPVESAEIIVSVGHLTKAVDMVYNNTFPVKPSQKRAPRIGIDFEAAYDIAWQDLRVHGELTDTPAAQLVYRPNGENFDLVYLVNTGVEAPFGHWQHTIDAGGGEVLDVRRTTISRIPEEDQDFSAYDGPVWDRGETLKAYEAKLKRLETQASQLGKAAADGSGQVFDPDPVTTLQDDTLEDNSPASAFTGAYFNRTLKDIDLTGGVYRLNGPWITIANTESPNTAPSTTTSGNWTATRGNNAFNDAMTYFHVDQSQRYMQSLGFTGSTGIQFGPITVDTDGAGGDDNSYFIPSANRMVFGHGCVDDNEDMFVILHEYGHAIHHSINSNWSGGDTGGMGEGFGDYWAGSYRFSTPNGSFRQAWAFPWDGHNNCWGGRDMDQTQFQYNPNNTYPAHATVGGVYSDELWSTPLFQALLTLTSQGVDRTEVDQIILQAHFGLGSGLSMRDMATAIVNTAQSLYPSGPHAGVFTDKFEAQNILDGGGPPPSGTELQNGASVTGLSGAQGSETRYFIQVPAGASNLNIAISGGSGDCDLYTRFANQPTTSTYDCRPYVGGNNESCPVASPSTGTYHIMLRGYSAYSGVTLTASYDTGSNQAPNASFSESINGLSVSFTDNSSDSDGTIASRSWNFGDGNSSSAANPSHTYAAAGTYTVTLTVTDNDGATDNTSKSITVSQPNQAPNAAFSESISNLTVTFTDNSSDSDGTIASRSWNFGDGNTSTATNPSHSYAASGTYTVTLTVTDNDGASDATSKSITVSQGGGGGLENGESVTGLAGSTGDWEYFTIDVPAGASNLVVAISGGSGDADLYTRFGAQPTTSAYDCRPWLNGNSETCTVASPNAGTYHIGVRAYSNYSGVTLTVSYTEPGGGCADGFTESGLSGSTGSWKHYTIVVPACASNLNIAMSGGSGDADLYTRLGAQPTTSSYDCRPYAAGNNEDCSVSNPTAGTWHISIRAYSTYSGVTLQVDYD